MDEIRQWLIVMTAISALPIGWIYYQIGRKAVSWIRIKLRERDVVGRRLEYYARGDRENLPTGSPS